MGHWASKKKIDPIPSFSQRVMTKFLKWEEKKKIREGNG
jgi:hypothetical protein